MTHYPDASVVVSAFTDEVFSKAAGAWMRSVAAGELLTSAWCETEVASALAMKVRTGELASAQRRPLLRLIRSTLAESAATIPIEHRHFAHATDLLDRSERPLRASDALHLAIAADSGATLCTLDRRMAEAGVALGLDVELLR